MRSSALCVGGADVGALASAVVVGAWRRLSLSALGVGYRRRCLASAVVVGAVGAGGVVVAAWAAFGTCGERERWLGHFRTQSRCRFPGLIASCRPVSGASDDQ